MNRCCVLDGNAKDLERIEPHCNVPLPPGVPAADPIFKGDDFGHFSQKAQNSFQPPLRVLPVTPKIVETSASEECCFRDSTQRFHQLLQSQFAELERTLLEEYEKVVRVCTAPPSSARKLTTTFDTAIQTDVDWFSPIGPSPPSFKADAISASPSTRSGVKIQSIPSNCSNGDLGSSQYRSSRKSRSSVKTNPQANSTMKLLECLPQKTLEKVRNNWEWDHIKTEDTSPDLSRGWGRCLRQLPRELVGKLFMNFIVITNTVVLGFEAGSSWTGWFVVDALYALVFVVEQIILFMEPDRGPKFPPGGFRRFSIKTSGALWHWFDFILAIFSVVDVIFHIIAIAGPDPYVYSELDQPTGNALLLRFARLVRLTRIFRLLKIDLFKDLVMMINGAVGGLRTLGWSLVLIIVPVYAFALFLTESVGLEASVDIRGFDVSQHFESVSRSMFTNFRCLVLADCSSMDGTPIFPVLMRSHGWGYGVAYCFISVCMSFGLFNVIVAIYVENTLQVAKSNEALQRQRRLENQERLAKSILDLTRLLWRKLHEKDIEASDASAFDLNKALNMEMTQAFFNQVVELDEMRNLLNEIEVPSEDHRDLFEVCDADGGGVLTVDELVSGVKKLRGAPRRSDIVFIMLRVNTLMAEVQGLKEFVELTHSSHSAHAAVGSFFLNNVATPSSSQEPK